MTEHEKLLNSMMSNMCPQKRAKDGVTRLFVFDLHCNEIWVIARFMPNADEEYRYEILAWKLRLNRTDEYLSEWASFIDWAVA